MSARTLRRDVERLRGYGYPVDTRRGPGGHYRLAAGTHLPPLQLDDDEAIAAVLGLTTLSRATPSAAGVGEAADRALSRIDAVFPGRLRPRLSALRASVESEHPPAPDVPVTLLGDLAEAISAHELVAFDYTDARGAVTNRTIDAYRQVHLDGRWYLFGWDPDRADWRVFRTDRIAGLRRTGKHHGERELPAPTALAYLRSGLGDPVPPVAHVFIDAPLGIVADAFRHDRIEVEADDDRTTVTFFVDAWPRILPGLAVLEASWRIEGSPDVREGMRRFAERFSRMLER